MDALLLKTHLLCHGVQFEGTGFKGGRRAGAGPAGACIDVRGILVNLPISMGQPVDSHFKLDLRGNPELTCGAERFPVRLIPRPEFYDATTSDGTPMKKIALLHGRDCLATTLYQRCVLMEQDRGCGFCAINGTLKDGSTVLRKTPQQLEETAALALKDGVTHITITTGTPNLVDHGTRMMAEAVRHLKEAFDLPIHVQISPPGGGYIEEIYQAGADTIGIHIETFDRGVLDRVCPGKTGMDYMKALNVSVGLFGESQVSSFIIGGLGEDEATMSEGFESLASIGVIPFLVPFRPLPGSRLEGRKPPDPDYMKDLYLLLADTLSMYGVDIRRNKAGCVRCGACSALDVAVGVR